MDILLRFRNKFHNKLNRFPRSRFPVTDEVRSFIPKKRSIIFLETIIMCCPSLEFICGNTHSMDHIHLKIKPNTLFLCGKLDFILGHDIQQLYSKNIQ